MNAKKYLDISGTQYINGIEDSEFSNIFVISGVSTNYCWSKTEDNSGIVVWDSKTKEHDILWNIDYISFSDGYLHARDDNTFSFSNEIGEKVMPITTIPEEVQEAIKIQNNAGTEYITGSENQDIFVIDGKADEYNWDKTVDGTGTVVWNIATGEHDILWNVENIQFSDSLIDLVEQPCFYHEPAANSSLGDTVWLDGNRDGDQDSGEKGAANVTVQLKNAQHEIIATQVTDANGKYLFESLEAGDYSVTVVAPDGYDFTHKDAGNDDAVDSDVDEATGNSKLITLGENEHNLSIDAGLVLENNDPDAKNDQGEGCGEPIKMNVLTNDRDPDGDNLAVTSVQQGENGTTSFSANGEVVYTPNDGFSGQDSFTYTISDGKGGTDTATVNVEVDEATVATFVASSTTVREGQTQAIKINLDEVANEDTILTLKVSEITAGLADSDLELHSGYILGSKEATFYYGTEADKAQALNESSAHHRLMESRYGLSDEELRDIPVGVENATQDFHIKDSNGNIIDIAADGTFQVTVPAGQSMSDTFLVSAIYDMHLVGSHSASDAQEGNEKLSLQVMQIDGTDCVDNAPVEITITNTTLRHTPIALDLNKDGKIGVTGETSSHQKYADAEIGRTVEFDIDADGSKETIEWYDGSGDGILIDNRDGLAVDNMDGSRLFGDEGGKYSNGFEKLAALDVNGDGILKGAELDGLELWVDDGDAIVEDGEIQSLETHDIVEVSTQMEIIYDDQGRELMQSSSTTSDGSTILSEDVWFAEQSKLVHDLDAQTESDMSPIITNDVDCF